MKYDWLDGLLQLGLLIEMGNKKEGFCVMQQGKCWQEVLVFSDGHVVAVLSPFLPCSLCFQQ